MKVYKITLQVGPDNDMVSFLLVPANSEHEALLKVRVDRGIITKCEEVEGAMSDTLTIGQVAGAIRCHERTARKMLQEAGADLDPYREDQSEPVARGTVIDLYAMKGGSVARHLSPLLSATMPKG